MKNFDLTKSNKLDKILDRLDSQAFAMDELQGQINDLCDIFDNIERALIVINSKMDRVLNVRN